MADNNGIGNYKGVMLCNRPFAGVSAAAKKTYNETKGGGSKPFLSCCSNAEPLGLNPIRHPPNVVVDRSKKDTALSKHKKWLSELKKHKHQMEKELIEQSKLREEKRNNFREKLRMQREKVIRQRRGEDYNPSGREDADMESDEREEKMQDESRPNTPLFSEEKQKEKQKLEKRPAWALSQQDAEKLEDLEADELLDFAQGLDFDTFLDDLEKKSTAPSERQSKESKEREGKEEDPETQSTGRSSSGETGLTAMYEYFGLEGEAPTIKAAIREAYRKKKESRKTSDGGWNSSVRTEEETNGTDAGETASVASARSILSNTSVKSLKQIHSARSLAKVAARIVKESDSESLRSIEEEKSVDESKFQPPRVVSIHEDGRSRLTNKDETYNLPYMHRNPAV